MKYLPYLDGLRAVAVLLVLLFHLDIGFFKGGFLGVDVFFVISGFLITKIILTEIKKTNDFNFLNFYARRIRRLYPALFVVFVLTLVASSFVLTPDRISSLGWSTFFSNISLSNFFFWFESGYFDTDSSFKPMLHTWSLSVEEQFYLIWPLSLYVTSKCFSKFDQKKWLYFFGVVGFLANFIWCKFQFDRSYIDSIFYLMPFRVFEFSIGGLAVFYFPKKLDNVLKQDLFFITGLVLIGFSVFGYKVSNYSFIYELFTCVGVFFIIVSPFSRLSKILLTGKFLVFIGLLSYSIYLIHWPIISLYKFHIFRELNNLEKFSISLVTVCLAYLNFKFIETKFRYKSKDNYNYTGLFLKKTYIYFSIASLFIAVLAYGSANTLAAGKQSKSILSLNDINAWKENRRKDYWAACSIKNISNDTNCKSEKALQVMFFGNSHETDAFNIFHSLYGKNPYVNLITFGTTNECDLYENNGFAYSTRMIGPYSFARDYKCKKRVKLLNSEKFVKKLDVLIYSSSKPFENNRKEMWAILERMQKQNKNLKIIVIGGYFSFQNECSDIIQKYNSLSECYSKKYIEYNPLENEHELVKARLNKIQFLYISKIDLLCGDHDKSSCTVSLNDKPIIYDKSHLTKEFSVYLGKKIYQYYSKELRQIGFPKL